MGWETGVSLGASAVQGFATMNNARAVTGAMAQSAENEAGNIANRTSRNIGTLETSFLKGGIALGGAGTAAIFAQAGQQGQTDIHRTIDNANAQINNTFNSARTGALKGLGDAYAKLGPNAISDAYKGSLLQTAWNELGQDVGATLDPSPVGPYRAFGV